MFVGRGGPTSLPAGPAVRYRLWVTDEPFVFFADLLAEATIPDRGIHSQTLSREGGVELVLFAFAAGEALAEHTAARPAIIHFLAGEAEVTLGDERLEARAGSWMQMAARLPHSILARTPVVMALYLLPAEGPTKEP